MPSIIIMKIYSQTKKTQRFNVTLFLLPRNSRSVKSKAIFRLWLAVNTKVLLKPCMLSSYKNLQTGKVRWIFHRMGNHFEVNRSASERSNHFLFFCCGFSYSQLFRYFIRVSQISGFSLQASRF